MKATWNSESESEEDIDTTNICFMAKGNETTKVRAKLSSTRRYLTNPQIRTNREREGTKWEDQDCTSSNQIEARNREDRRGTDTLSRAIALPHSRDPWGRGLDLVVTHHTTNPMKEAKTGTNSDQVSPTVLPSWIPIISPCETCRILLCIAFVVS